MMPAATWLLLSAGIAIGIALALAVQALREEMRRP